MPYKIKKFGKKGYKVCKKKGGKCFSKKKLSKKKAEAQRAAISIATHESFSLVEIIKEALQGTRDVAQRMVNAEERFLSYAQEFGNLTREQAIKALEAYRKAKVIKIDPIGGDFTFKHGAFADKEVLRRAAGLDEK